MTDLNIPKSDLQRVVIIGAGFAGMQLAQKLAKKNFQVVLIDKHNYHQFQPLFYQVAMAGLEPSAISFPLRKAFQSNSSIVIRICEFLRVEPDDKRVITSLGELSYDILVFSYGAKTNFFGNQKIEQHTLSMKSTEDAIKLRNEILLDYERAILEKDFKKRQKYLDIVIVGGGATGVELAGALVEMKKYIVPKDYTEINYKEMDIYLIQGAPDLLMGMSDNAMKKSREFLESMGVKVMLNTRVDEVHDDHIITGAGERIDARKVIWAAGVTCLKVDGLEHATYSRDNRVMVDRQCRVVGYDDIYALGDMCRMATPTFPEGHPQVAQVALQQAKHVARNLINNLDKSFVYDDKGSMATIGRNKAVVDLPKFKFSGFFAWILWLVVHLFSLIGVRNKVFVFFSWVWNYITYDQSLRLIIRPSKEGLEESQE